MINQGARNIPTTKNGITTYNPYLTSTKQISNLCTPLDLEGAPTAHVNAQFTSENNEEVTNKTSQYIVMKYHLKSLSV